MESSTLDDDLKIPRATYEATKDFIVKYRIKLLQYYPTNGAAMIMDATKIAAMALKRSSALCCKSAEQP